MIGSVTSVPIDAATAGLNANLDLIVETLNQAGEDAKRVPGNPGFKGLSVYGISIDFDQFPKEQNALRDEVKSIGTSWNLSATQRSAVKQAAATLLQEQPCFQQLANDLHLQSSGTALHAENMVSCQTVPAAE